MSIIYDYNMQNYPTIMGDGIGGPVMDCLSGNMFRMYVTHFRKDNSEEYSKLEKIHIVKVENDDSPQPERTMDDLEQALKGKFVTCNVQYRDKKTDILFCNVFIQNPPDGF